MCTALVSSELATRDHVVVLFRCLSQRARWCVRLRADELRECLMNSSFACCLTAKPYQSLNPYKHRKKRALLGAYTCEFVIRVDARFDVLPPSDPVRHAIGMVPDQESPFRPAFLAFSAARDARGRVGAAATARYACARKPTFVAAPSASGYTDATRLTTHAGSFTRLPWPFAPRSLAMPR